MTESFCVLPWVNITVDPDGAIKPCCISHDYIKKEDGTKFNLGYDSIDDIYNSKEYVELRQKMLDNEYISGCDVCYHNEKTGRQSRRLINNEQYKDVVPTTTESNLKIKFCDVSAVPANTTNFVFELNWLLKSRSTVFTLEYSSSGFSLPHS